MTRTLLTPLILVLAVLGELSTQIYVPALAELVHDFASTPATVQSSLWVFLIGFGVGQLVIGPASDRWGRRPVLIGGLVLYLAATGAALFAASIETFIVARFLQALGVCAAFVMSRAIIRDVYPVNQIARGISANTLAIAVTVALAPTIGGWISDLWGWRATLGLLLLIGSLLLLVVVLLFKESNQHISSSPFAGTLLSNYGELLRARGFLSYALPLSFTYGAMFAYVCSAPIAVRELLEVTPHALGLIFGGILSGFIAGIVMSRPLVSRLGVTRVAGLGSSIVLGFTAVTAAALWAWGPSYGSVVLPQVILTFGAGLIFPSATAGAITPYGTRAGSAAAMIGFLQMAIGAIFGVLATFAYDGTVLPMIAVQLICAVTAFTTFRWLQAAPVAQAA